SLPIFLRQAGHDMKNSQEFVTTLYRGLLGREPDSSGLAYWKEALDSGASTRAQLVTHLSASPEAMQEIVPVTQLYLLAFGRAADAEGLQYWVEQMRDGMRYTDVVHQ